MNVKNLEMVRLKKIEIFGFKSFADRSELEFNPGVTAIVGPNGCGKSNISDAFRWVLGEQSAKSMRGTKMPDVIFAGTSHRKPLNFAEVTITLCNACGLLPIEFSEVAVTRRLHRNGESDYFINKNPVRMKDIHSLLLDSGMGKNTFSIFEQGKIDQVINFSALERRYIFEEAAGILRFLQRKKEALAKLKDADSNTERVKDIHKEEEKHIALLESQAEKAKLFKENKQSLDLLEKTVFVQKREQLLQKREGAKEKEKGQKDLLENVSQEFEKELKLLSLVKVELEESEKVLKVANENYFKAKSEREIKALEKKGNQERKKELEIKQKNLKLELESIKEKQRLRHAESKAAEKNQLLLQREVSKEEEKLKAKKESLMLLETEIAKLRDSQQRSQAQVVKLMQEESQFEGDFRQNSIRIEGIKERKAQAAERLLKLDALILELLATVKEKQKELDEASAHIDDRKNLFFDLEEKIAFFQENIKENSEKREHALQETFDLKANQKTLLRLKEDMEGFSFASKKILKEAKNQSSSLFQKVFALYEFIKPKKGTEKAIAAALSFYKETLAVKKNADLEDLMLFAEKEKLKNFSVVSLEAFKGNKAVLLEKQKGLEPLLSAISKQDVENHFLSHVLIAKEKAQALAFASSLKEVSVFCEGLGFIDQNGVLFYGDENEGNAFLREAELENIQKRQEELEIALQSLENALKVFERQKAETIAERNELDKSIRKEEMKLVEINFGLQRGTADLNRYQTEKKQITDEEKSLNESLKQLEASVTEAKQKHLETKVKAEEAKSLNQKTSEEVSKQAALYGAEAKEFQVLDATFQKAADENRKLLHALNVFEIKEIESKTQEERVSQELESNEELLTFILSKGEEVDAGSEMVEKALEESASLCSRFEEELKNKKNKIMQVEAKTAALQEKLKKVEKEIYQSGILLAEVNSFLISLEKEANERYQLSVDELKALDLPKKRQEEIEKEIRLLKAEIDAAGDINMTSIEQLRDHKQRYEFLNGQLEDLSKSKQELIEIIAELDQESRKIFKETFDIVRENFKKNFQILFNGGEADLEFVESADILEAGIEISAKPPGKQMRSISLLSGGEKCLTAMALLFAIFEVKPAPFCILDEIDAPLDDSNVERFVNVVKQFIDRCQFIIITHNKRTMAIADALWRFYGGKRRF
ncbi:MAG TPA: chromosome segregation protein SMC [Parachlamydiaceae bacterium]|nr:chromosome segregation protein SMC [Parachlamydiaceae bacterium]